MGGKGDLVRIDRLTFEVESSPHECELLSAFGMVGGVIPPRGAEKARPLLPRGYTPPPPPPCPSTLLLVLSTLRTAPLPPAAVGAAAAALPARPALTPAVAEMVAAEEKAQDGADLSAALFAHVHRVTRCFLGQLLTHTSRHNIPLPFLCVCAIKYLLPFSLHCTCPPSFPNIASWKKERRKNSPPPPLY